MAIVVKQRLNLARIPSWTIELIGSRKKGLTMKISASILYCLCLVTTLSACGGSSGKNNDSPAPNPEKADESPEDAKTDQDTDNGQEADKHQDTTKAQPSEAQPSEAQPSEAQPSEAQPSEAQPSEAQPSEAQPATNASAQIPNSLILGTWKQCTPAEESEFFQYLSMSFSDDGKVTMKFKIAKDANCTDLVGEAELAEWKRQMVQLFVALGVATDEAEKMLESLASGQIDYSYKVGEAIGEGAYAIDLTIDGSTAYTAYKVDGNKLYLAETCDEDDAQGGDCPAVSGDAPARRATAFDDKFFTKE